jgi:hypothetical protein
VSHDIVVALTPLVVLSLWVAGRWAWITGEERTTGELRLHLASLRRPSRRARVEREDRMFARMAGSFGLGMLMAYTIAIALRWSAP